MITYLSNIINKAQKFSKKLDEITVLTDRQWVQVSDDKSNKKVYIFRENKELLISTNGTVERAKWDYLGANSILIEKATSINLFKNAFVSDRILILRIDGSDEFALFVCESDYIEGINTIEMLSKFIQTEYIQPTSNIPKEITFKQQKEYLTENGLITVKFLGVNEFPSFGDHVYQNESLVNSGKFKLDFMYHIVVRNGTIVRTTLF